MINYPKILELYQEGPNAIILSLSMVGAYSINNSIFDLYVALAFGIVGYLMQKVEMPTSPIVLAIILGPMAETNLRRSLLMYNGSLGFLYTRPITILFIVLSFASLISAFLS